MSATRADQPAGAAGSPWWKGVRGEWYVVVQMLLFALVLLGPRSWPASTPWTSPWTTIGNVTGAFLIGAGLVTIALAFMALGRNLSSLPHPKEEATLVQKGPYAVVRHPIYCGGILAAFGWALSVQGWLTLVYAAVLLLFFDLKSRREERFLAQKFPDYREYQHRVRKLIPFIY